MRPLLLIPSLLLLAGAARADSIDLYSDVSSGICAMPSVPFQMHTVYVFHSRSLGATGSSWRVENTSGMLEAGSSCDQLSITGSPFTGVSLSYGSCLTETFQICQLNLFHLSGDPIPGCYQLRVLGYPGDTPLVVDCSANEVPAAGGFFTFDVEGKLDCWDCTTPVESRTWGAVKALYR